MQSTSGMRESEGREVNRIDRFEQVLRQLPPRELPWREQSRFVPIRHVEDQDRPSAVIGWIALCFWTGLVFAAGVLAGAVWVSQ